MIRQNSLGSLGSLDDSFEKDDLDDSKAGSDNETIDSISKYDKIGSLIDLPDIKESICVKHYDEEGNKFYNEYKVIQPLGSGSFSKIELVEKEGVKYALKIIDKTFLTSQKNMEFDENGNVVVNTSLENALKEIAILKKTNHPNIIRLYEILHCNKNKKIYLILELCENGDLINYDDETGEFTLNEHVKEKDIITVGGKKYYSDKIIKKFFKGIISGLYYLHSNGIIHRDIKPNNILLSKNNICKITDFNVSSILQNKDEDNIGRKICSADHFRPPEGCNLSDQDEKKDSEKLNFQGKPIDIWALGVTLYILAYMKFPFESEKNSILELYDKIFKCQYTIPETPKRSGKLKCLIKKCLEKNPKKRITAENIMNHYNKKLKYHHKIDMKISHKEKLQSIKFLLPDCTAIFNTFKERICNEMFKYQMFKGKIFFQYQKFKSKECECKNEKKILEKINQKKEKTKNFLLDLHNNMKKRFWLKNYKKHWFKK